MDDASRRRRALELRRQRYRWGLTSEFVAALFLMAKGYRILGRRVKTSQGEIDLIVRTGRRVSFVEVKARPTFQEAEVAIASEQSQRIYRAADAWLRTRPRLAELDRTFDVVFVVPWSWPRHYVNSL